jgi:hypothetical protein
MYVSSGLGGGRVLAATLAVTLWGVRVPGSEAKQAQENCPTPSRQACTIDPHALHEAREARERALARQQKEAAHAQHEAEEARIRAQKEAEHARHEAEEARIKELKEAAHAQHEAEEQYLRQQKAYLRALHEADEAWERAAAKLAKAKALEPVACTLRACR